MSAGRVPRLPPLQAQIQEPETITEQFHQLLQLLYSDMLPMTCTQKDTIAKLVIASVESEVAARMKRYLQ
jgi:hypothetical protein